MLEASTNISEGTKQYDVMGYVDLNTMRLIFKIKHSGVQPYKRNLNDTMEKQRVGVCVANSRFITCFAHTHRKASFWMYYGKDVQEEKVLLNSFCINFEDCVKLIC